MMNGFSAPEIEQAAISAMLQWPEARTEGFAHLTHDHFYTDQNRRMFVAIQELEESGKTIELISFTHYLREKHLLESVGGAFYVTTTYASTCRAPQAMTYYVELLSEELSRRMLLTTCSEVAKSDLRGVERPVESTIETLSEIPRYKPRKDRTLKEAVEEKIDRMQHGKQDAGIIKTGLEKLDYHSPLWKSDMPLIAGERKAGKSILALTIATNVAKAGHGVAYFSLEDSERKVTDRLLAGASRISLTKQDHVDNLSQDEISQSVRAAAILKTLPIYIRDDVFDLVRIVAISKELKIKKDISLIVVDYGQLVKTSATKERNREQEVAHVSRTLRLLAMELETPLILLSQLNMDGFTRESRALEQDSTAMWKVTGDEKQPGKRWIEIPWQRNGESNVKFPVTFLGWCARIENYENEV